MKHIIDEFHKLYYDSWVWATNTTWLGVTIFKNPLDLMLYQETIYEIQPDLIIETGTWNGGSALFFASMMDLIGKGHIVSVDIGAQPNLPDHPRITYLSGNSIQEEMIDQVKTMIPPNGTVMVILDSDHSMAHVLAEMNVYSELVTTGSYLVVEDTAINGHPIVPEFGPGPMEAVDAFLQENDRFVVDESKHKFFVTDHPRGFLRKIK